MASHPLKDFVVKFKAGETVYREGDPGAEMFIVQSGAVRIFRDLGGREQALAEMEKGEFFGEMSVLEGQARTSSARALEDYAAWARPLVHVVMNPWYYDFDADLELDVDLKGVKAHEEGRVIYEQMLFHKKAVAD